MNMPNPQTGNQYQPGPTGQTVCPYCGASNTLRSRQREITTKKRVKFGVLWVVLTVATGGAAVLVWLMMPRRNEVIGVDRWTECTQCKSTL